MLLGSAQTIFTPISTSAEFVGSQIYFERVQPGIEIPVGYTAVGESGEQQYDCAHGRTHSSVYEASSGGVAGFGENYAEMRRSASNKGFYTRRSLRDSMSSRKASSPAEKRGEGDSTAGNDGESDDGQAEQEREKEEITYIDGFRLPSKATGTLSLLHSRIGDAGLLLHPFFSRLLEVQNSPSGGGSSLGLGSRKRSPAMGGMLHTLDLSYCALTCESFASILSIISALPNLQRLYLTGNTFSLPTKVIFNHNFSTSSSSSIPVVSPFLAEDTQHTPTSPSSNSSSISAGNNVVLLDAFLDSLCDRWEAHPSLSLVVLDPWIVSHHARFRLVRQRRVSLQRWQALESTLGKTGFSRAISSEASSPVLLSAYEEGQQTSRLRGSDGAVAEDSSLVRKAKKRLSLLGADGVASLSNVEETLSVPRSKRSKKKDLLDDDEDDDEDKPFSNIGKSIDATAALSSALALPFGAAGSRGATTTVGSSHQQQENNQRSLNNASSALKATMIRQALVQLRVRESARREALQTEEMAAVRAILSKASDSYAMLIAIASARMGMRKTSVTGGSPLKPNQTQHGMLSGSFAVGREDQRGTGESQKIVALNKNYYDPDSPTVLLPLARETDQKESRLQPPQPLKLEGGVSEAAAAEASVAAAPLTSSLRPPRLTSTSEEDHDFNEERGGRRSSERQIAKFLRFEEKMRDETVRHEESSRARCLRTEMAERLQIIQMQLRN